MKLNGRKCAANIVRTLLCGSMLAVLPHVAHAQDVPEDQMIRIGSSESTYSRATRVSSDGRVVIGFMQNPDYSNTRAFVWTSAGGIEALGTLGGDYSYANDLSDDGSVIVGYATQAGVNGYNRAFRWTAAGGMVGLDMPEGYYSNAYAVSGDGAVIVGQIGIAYPYDGYSEAVRWSDTGAMQTLGSLGGLTSSAQLISRDGQVIAGYATLANGEGRAFRWTEDGGMQDLGTLGGTYSNAYALSRDGRVIVGSTSTADSTNPLVFRWTADGGMESIGTLSGNGIYARAVSNDGNAITGEGHTASDQFHAYRWTADGGMQDLGTLGGTYSTGEDISGDGSVVVGLSTNADNRSRAFRWTEEGGMQDLGTLGGTYASAVAVSEDGSTIVGYSANADNQTQAFIYRTRMQDFTNMIGSFGLLANDVSVAMEYQRETASWLMERNCALRDDQRFCLGADGMMNFTSSNVSPNIDPRRDAAAKISAGARISSAVTIGAGVSIVDYRNEIGAITPDTGYAYGAWLSYAPRGASLLGLKARAGVSLADQKNVVERGIGLDNVEVTEGQTTIKSSVVRGELGYGLPVGNGAVITPIAAVTWQNSKMAAFEEAAGDFPASFAAQSFDTIYGTTGVELSMPATKTGRFTLAGKVDFDLNSDAIALVGTSTIPNLEQFAITAGMERQDVRAKVEAGYAQQVGPGVVSVNAQIATPTYGGHARFGLGFGFNVGF